MTAKDLKNALLQEAVQGKLVPQIASEGNAQDLLNAIRKEKNELVKSGKIKKEKPLPEITDEEKPFDIPESWCWCRLGELITFVGGYAYDSHSFIEKSEYQVLRLGNVKNGYLQLSTKPVYINAELADKTNAFKCITNDILVTMTGTRLKRDYFFTTLISENDKNLYVNQRVGCLRPTKIIFASFLAWILKSKTILDYIFEFETGTANQGNLGSENIKTIPIPLPPLSEQKRIVSKLEELLPLIEEYGKAQEELDTLNNEIPEKLKKAILQEAIQGKLVPQIASEGNAKDLLHKIETERKKSNPKYKLLPPVTDEEKPFEIPESWVWCRIGDLFFTTSGGTPLKGHPEFYVNGTIPWVKSGELKSKYLYNAETLITEEALKNSSAKYFPVNTVAVAMYGATIGKTSIFKKELTTNQAICGIFPNTHILPEYLYYFIQAKIQDYLSIAFGSGQPNISQEKIKETLFPLPPLSEQKRIVYKLEELLGEVEKLKR